jgi:amino acid transporter
LAITLGDYMSTLVKLGAYSNYLWAALSIVLLSVINLVGIQQGKWTQNVLTLLEVAGVMAIVYAGFSKSEALTWAQLLENQSPASNYGLAMVFVLLTFGGWNEAAYLSAEVKDEKRGVVKALVWGLGLVTFLYLLANLAYFSTLGLQGMASSSAVASEVFMKAYGRESAMVFSGIVVFSCLNSLNATIIFGARSAFALGQDFRSFAWLGRWHASGNPRNSLILQMVLALAVVGLAILTRQGFEAVVEFTAPVFWTFILLVGVAVLVLRRRHPDMVRPFKVPLYPVLPVLFILVTAWMLWSSLMYTGAGAWVGVAVLACGLIPLAWERWGLQPSTAAGH